MTLPHFVSLPIDAHLSAIVERLTAAGSLALIADAGAGKTTRVPRALLDAGLAERGEILVLEPRRLATRMAARRVASELGEPVGERIGYQVRFEEVASPRTRVRFITEGILLRRLLGDPRLTGVAVVLLDELHERHLQTDVALALLRRLQRRERPDLKLLAMSATLDAAPVAAFLGGEVIAVEGRRFPVAIEWSETALAATLPARDVGRRVGNLLARRLASLDGDVLVFLPGAAEIRCVAEALADAAERAHVEVMPLHGDLPIEEQERAIRPGTRRRVILSTNVAETSLTVEGVTLVVDSGLARRARHSPWSGLPSLETVLISQAAAAQRAGRAGRLGPGRCLRLYRDHDFKQRPSHDPPEIRSADLSGTLLALHSLLGREGAALAWLESPPEGAVAAAEVLLSRLGALDGDGRITMLGRAMLDLPLEPRAARLALAAAERGVGGRGALLAALLSERDILRETRTSVSGAPRARDLTGPSDLLDRLENFEAAEGSRAGGREGRARAAGLDAGALRAVARSADEVRRILGRSFSAQRASAELVDEERALLQSILVAFPDRVARRRAPSSADLVLAGGGMARLAGTSLVTQADLLVAVEASERREARGGRVPLVRWASAIEPEWLLDFFPQQVSERREARFDPATARVVSASALLYDGLVLEESRRLDATGPEIDHALAEAVLASWPDAFINEDRLAALEARLAFAASHAPAGKPLDRNEMGRRVADLCHGLRSLDDVRRALVDGGGLEGIVLRALGPGQRAQLERLAPEKVALPDGRRLPVVYQKDQPPHVASRLQDFFGLAEGPRVGEGRVPLVLHLLAPNQRPVQVTSDLAGFWERHYPSLRRALMRRYPKHAWPEDPRHALPPKPRGRR